MSECANCVRLAAKVTEWEQRYERLALHRVPEYTPLVAAPPAPPPSAIDDAIEQVAQQAPDPGECRRALGRYVIRMTARGEKENAILAGIHRGGDEPQTDDD